MKYDMIWFEMTRYVSSCDKICSVTWDDVICYDLSYTITALKYSTVVNLIPFHAVLFYFFQLCPVLQLELQCQSAWVR